MCSVRTSIVCSFLILWVVISTTGCARGVANRSSSLSGLGLTGAETNLPLQQDPLTPEQTAQTCIVTAEALEKQSHDREAILLYEKARTQDPKAIDYARRLSVLYERQQQPSQALVEYRNALQASPENSDLLNDFGYFQLQQGDLRAAEDALRRAIQLDGQHARARINLGIVLAHQGRYQESYQAFASVVGTAAAHANVGAIMAKRGETEEAKRQLSQALELGPELKQPRALLAYLDNRPQPGSQ